EVRGLLKAEWGTSDNNRRAKFYTLTAVGRRELDEEAAYWDRVAAAVTRVMQTAPRARSRRRAGVSPRDARGRLPQRRCRAGRRAPRGAAPLRQRDLPQGA